MKTEQEQIKAIKQIIDERIETNLGQVQGRHGNVIKTVDTIIIARDIIEAGYGDVKQAQIDVLKELKTQLEAKEQHYICMYDWDGHSAVVDCANEVDELIEEIEK